MGFKAGTLSQYLRYGLTAAGYELICMEARQIKAALSAISCAPAATAARTSKASRATKSRAALKPQGRAGQVRGCRERVRGLFKIFGIKLPPRLGHGAFDGAARETIEADEASTHALLPLLDAQARAERTAEREAVYETIISNPDARRVLISEKQWGELTEDELISLCMHAIYLIGLESLWQDYEAGLLNLDDLSVDACRAAYQDENLPARAQWEFLKERFHPGFVT